MRYLTVLLFVGISFAQVAPVGSLVGDVKDASDATVAAATITLTNIGTQAVKTTQTGPEGRFAFRMLPIGVYSVRATAAGFSALEQTGIRVEVDSARHVTLTLAVGALTEQVTVSADAAMVTTESGTLSQVIGERYISDLPLNGRNAASLVFMVPGTVAGINTTTAGYANSDETIAVSANGARGNEVNYKLDGATHVDNVTNLNAAYPNPDAIAEFSVQTSNFSAQFGTASGAVVSMVTRSGTNRFRGSFFDFLRNDTLKRA